MAEGIFKLDQDLLWRTLCFIIQSDTDKEWDTEIINDKPSLTTLRRASQACSSWRVLTLSTPSWWGRLIHLNSLNQTSADWRNEVLARSGKSALHITGSVCCDEHFLEMLLDKHWDRIRVLRINCDSFISHYLHFDLFQYLQRPAPSMEICAIQVNGWPDPLSRPLPPNFRLFSNSAPSLRYLRAFPPQLEVYIDLRAPFMAQFRILDLARCGVSSHQLLDILESTHFLEELINVRLTITEIGKTRSSEFHEIKLPHLRRVAVYAFDVDGWLHVLSNIIPAPQCAFDTSLNHCAFSLRKLSAADILAISRVLSFYAENYSTQQSQTRVRLHFDRRSILFSHEYGDKLPSLFCFSLQTKNSVPAHTISTLLQSLSPYDLSTAVSLDLYIAESCNLEPGDPDFTRLMASTLASVRILISDLPTIQFLLRLDTLPVAPATILPSLREIRYPYSTDDPQVQLLATFIYWMLRVGNPVELLDVTPDLDYEYRSRDFRFLEQITGLKVNWNVGKFYSPTDKKEYICGSSTPDCLYFGAVVEGSSRSDDGLELESEATELEEGSY